MDLVFEICSCVNFLVKTKQLEISCVSIKSTCLMFIVCLFTLMILHNDCYIEQYVHVKNT